jgi:hypothetical protein
MAFVAEHPERATGRLLVLGRRRLRCGHLSLDDVLRSIALDERHHKEHSLAAMRAVVGGGEAASAARRPRGTPR